MFDLAYSPEQELLLDAYRRVLERECDTEVVRAHEQSGFSDLLWARVVELGGVDMAIPEAAGGSGGQFLDAVVIHEVLGAYLAPVPLAETVVAARLLANLGTGAALDLLAGALQSNIPMTIAPRAARAGRLRAVPAGAVAGLVVARDGDRVVVLSGPSSRRGAPNLGSLPVADRSLGAGVVEVASGSAALGCFDDAVLEWRALVAALMTGAGQRALAIGVDYTKSRYAFGVPIASFQSIAHRMADAATALDGAMLVGRKAGWAVDAGTQEWRPLAQMAFVAGAQAARHVTDEVLHFHGGYGFMQEYDIQLYFRRVKAWALQDGDPAASLEQLADLLWDRPAATGAA
jgi:alkylation response protein AidB-like acyl-CoA dehydrogenase